MRARSPSRLGGRARPQAVQHRGGPRVRRDLLGPPRVLSADEGDRRRLSDPRFRGRPNPSAAVRPGLALPHGDREGLQGAREASPSGLRRRPARVPESAVGHRSPSTIPAAGCVTPPRHNVYSTAAALIRTEVSRIPRSLQESLETLADDVLLELAQAHGVEAAESRGREKMIHALLGLPDSAGVAAEADRLWIESRLERLRPRQLRELGERHRVSLEGLKKKSDLVAAIAAAPVSPEILMELEAQDTAERDSGVVLGRDADVDYERVEDLLEQARKRFQERQFEAALTAAQEASRIAERTTEQLRRASWSYAVLAAQGLLEPCNPEDPETATARALLDRARDVFFQGQLMDDAFLQDLVRAAEVAHAREAERVRDLLALTRDSIREAANLGASIALAEDAWKRGGDDLDRDRLAAARESFVEAGQRAEDARLRRIREVEESIGLVSDHIALARNVGADMQEAEGLHQAARTAVAVGEHGQAGDLLKRAERLSMKGQQRQIERAMQLRRAQVEKAQAIINACEPVLKEAESYDLSATEVRVLLRQAQDVLTKGDYLVGLTFARNAEEAAQRLEAQVADERRRRGIQVPASGTCGVCRSPRVTFQDDGWGWCEDCGNTFRWRGAFGVWERLKAILIP